MTTKLSEAQRALVKLIKSGFADRRYMDHDELERHGLLAEFKIVRRAGLIQTAGYECSPAGDAFLDSAIGRRAKEASHV